MITKEMEERGRRMLIDGMGDKKEMEERGRRTLIDGREWRIKNKWKNERGELEWRIKKKWGEGGGAREERKGETAGYQR